MAAPSSGNIIRVPGRLLANVTDLGLPEPYGGVYLGTVRNIRFRPRPIYRNIWAEELGAVSHVLYCGEGPCELSGILRYPDSDMLLTAANQPTSSGSSGVAWGFHQTITAGQTKPGNFINLTSASTSRTIKLLFAPKATTAHPMILLHNAIPMFDESVEIPMSMKDEYAIAVKFIGVPNGNGVVYTVAQRSNINLNA